MCGRYASPDKEAIVGRWPKIHCNGGGAWKSSANVAPTATVPLVVPARDGGLDLRAARWGLVPAWWTKAAPPSLTFNARAEDAAQKPTWRDALRTARGLMPARGWYEWHRTRSALDAAGREVKQPYFFHCPGEPVIAFAALWALWNRPGADPVLSCALLSRPAAPNLSAIHPRMPMALKPDQFARWLDPAASPDALQALLADVRQDVQAHPVSTRVNDARNDVPDLMNPIRTAPTSLFPADES